MTCLTLLHFDANLTLLHFDAKNFQGLLHHRIVFHFLLQVLLLLGGSLGERLAVVVVLHLEGRLQPPEYFRRHAGILNGLAAGRTVVFGNGENDRAAIFHRDRLALGGIAIGAFSHYLGAIVFHQGRGQDLGGSGCSAISEHRGRQAGDRFRGIYKKILLRYPGWPFR